MVQLLLRMTAAPGHLGPLTDALRSLKRQVQGHRGCSAVTVAADADDADALWYCEEWQDLDELEAHMRTIRFARLLALVETAALPPLLEFRLISETRGLDYIAAVRADLATEVCNATPD